MLPRCDRGNQRLLGLSERALVPDGRSEKSSLSAYRPRICI